MDNRRTNKKRAGASSEPPNAKSVQRPHATRRSGGITSSWRGCGGRRRSRSSNWKPTSEIGVERKVSDSTLWARVPIKRACRCVRVPAPGWGLSNRACRRCFKNADFTRGPNPRFCCGCGFPNRTSRVLGLSAASFRSVKRGGGG